jgi:hypothetical protein
VTLAATNSSSCPPAIYRLTIEAQAEQPQIPANPERTWTDVARRQKLIILLLIFFPVYCGIAWFYARLKPLPAGLSLEGDSHQLAAREVEFFYDATFMNGDQRVVKQVICDPVLSLIRGAEDFVLVALFLFNLKPAI